MKSQLVYQKLEGIIPTQFEESELEGFFPIYVYIYPIYVTVLETIQAELGKGLYNRAIQDGKEKPAAPPVQLNAIRLLAELNVFVKRPEVVDMILPLFIVSLEEGDASTPGLLRLRLLDVISRMASLGFEKSYREAVILMTQSYMGKLSAIDSTECKTQAPEATTERIEDTIQQLAIIKIHGRETTYLGMHPIL